MNFYTVIGNPPYQLNTGSGLNESGAVSIFPLFIATGLGISHKVCMITPTKWIQGDQSVMRLVRSILTGGKHLRCLVDYANSKECFPSNSIAGGVSYFLYDEDYKGDCSVTTILGKQYIKKIDLSKYKIIPRYSIAFSIVLKILSKEEPDISSHITKDKWKLPTNIKSKKLNSDSNSNSNENTDIKITTPKETFYISSEACNKKDIDKYHVMFTRVVSEHACEPSKDNKYSLLSSLEVLKPFEICNASYMTLGSFDTEVEAINAMNYLKTKFTRFLILQTLFGIGLSPERFRLVPMQDFSKSWTDEELYKKYGLDQEEIDCIESIMKPIN